MEVKVPILVRTGSALLVVNTLLVVNKWRPYLMVSWCCSYFLSFCSCLAVAVSDFFVSVSVGFESQGAKAGGRTCWSASGRQWTASHPYTPPPCSRDPFNHPPTHHSVHLVSGGIKSINIVRPGGLSHGGLIYILTFGQWTQQKNSYKYQEVFCLKAGSDWKMTAHINYVKVSSSQF